MISAFDDIPGYAYAILRTEGQPDTENTLEAHMSMAANGKAVGVAACTIVGRVANLIKWQLTHSAPQSGFYPLLTMRDATFVQVVLQSMENLLDMGTAMIAEAPPGPPVGIEDLRDALTLFGTGSAVGIRSVQASSQPQSFISTKLFSSKLDQTGLCRGPQRNAISTA